MSDVNRAPISRHILVLIFSNNFIQTRSEVRTADCVFRPYGTHCQLMDIHEFLFLSVFIKSAEKMQVSLCDKNNGYLHENLCTFMIYR